MTGCIEFRNDDAGYLVWLAAHPEGYVINIARNHNATQARVHHARCRTISGQISVGSTWTGPYVKVCAEHLAELERWAIETVGQPASPCGTCRPAGGAVRSASTKQTERPADGRTYISREIHATRPASGKPTEQAMAARMFEGSFEIHGPAADSPVVEAWADDYIRFERRPAWQEELRNQVRRRCSRLAPSAGQVLHATFCGPKLSNADVENLALYNIDSFKTAGRNGIRFEHCTAVPPAPDGAEYRFGYRYALAPSSGTFTHRQQGRMLASFDWIDLDASVDDTKDHTKLAQVWLALARARDQIEPPEPASAVDMPFAVRVQIRPPDRRQPVWGGLVKGIFDGVISAFQSHTDTAALPEVISRLATMLRIDPAEIEKHLLEQRWAVLGAVPRLVSPYRGGVKWDPADHWCVAGELLPADPGGPRWAIKGELIAVT
ncbi:hypothetical protein [Mycobacterium branderi]|uniref:Uncharacterized protein n=1 Tax=Mycobacterium branderi TaxID=43348 RepID=A0A7I7W9S7_9MYCO|nr:hypothetical protein [Mycobacterium branderi]MCV7231528.1 hypothetical protein [Mycobacterium branderi]ORA37396.1 hypothetical protein BST20_13130 [Mycobacterium branderi]BBZ13592.1 hypothetical protein MBRA_37870 [Mycobacterium branderi]